MKRAMKTVLTLAAAVLAIPVLVCIFSLVNRPAFVQAYFGAEQTWVHYWPVYRQKWEVQKIAPFMCRIGLLSPVRVTVEPGISFLLDPRDLVPATILRTGHWQPEIWHSISPSLSDGSVFLDVGAHIGYFSMKATGKVGSTGHVVSFEPNPEILKLLRDNVEANQAQNVTVEPIACTDREQTLTIYAAGSTNTGTSSLSRNNANSTDEPPRPYSVRGRPIDDVVRELNLSRVDVIKIDVEGAEVLVLRGTINTLKRFHPKVVVEVIPEQLASFHTTPEELAALLKKAGYNHSEPLNVPPTDWEWTVQKSRAKD
jgi:FkbM family methyltransferase